jgi:hypothetical protein
MWLNQYLEYTNEHESPAMFHLWAGLTVVSGLLGRKVWMDKGFYRLYPNLFTVLVAGSARCRKTTAIEIAVGLAKNVEGVRQLNGKVSAEKFLHIHTIAENQPQKPTLIKADELATFLTRDGQGEKLIDVLTKLFDCPEQFTYDTITHGQKIIKEPYVTVLAGTTPETLDKVLPDTAVGGGFSSRIMFVYQADTEKPRKDFQSPDEAHVFMQTELTRLASHIALISGVASLQPDAREYYDSWYQAIGPAADSRLDGFVARKHDHVLRVAMLLCASRIPDNLKIDIADIHSAIRAVETVERFLPSALSGVGSTPGIKSVQDRIMRHVQAHGRSNRADLLKKVYGMVDARQFNLIVDTLIQSGMLVADNSCLFVPKPPPDKSA